MQMKLSLTVDQLLANGFVRVARWVPCPLSGIKLDGALSKTAGVYAFAVNGLVMYVGVATAGFPSRMNGYRNPGPTQSTNKRLKATISEILAKGNIVEVCIATPTDFEWNGLPVSAPIGLESGLIRSFHLPWNKAGK